MEKMPESFIWVALVISNVVALLTLLAAWKKANIARLLYFMLFAWAAGANARIATISPQSYLEYADFAVFPFYKNIILGWFSAHIQAVVYCIATCQAIVALGMLTKGPFFKIGCLGGIIFLIGITPLGIGSGFPSPLIWAFGLYLLLKQGAEQTFWKAVSSKKIRMGLPKAPKA